MINISKLQFLAFIFPIVVCASLSLEPPPPSSPAAIASSHSQSSTTTLEPNQILPTMNPLQTMSSKLQTTEKTIYLIRHAESLENVAYKGARRVQAAYASRKLPAPGDVVDAFKLAFKMFRPSVMNARLSDVGERQVSQLHASLEKDQFWQRLQKEIEKQVPAVDDLLVVHSPLVRAKQTAYGALLGPDCLALTPDALSASKVKDNQGGVHVDLTELPSLREVNPGEIIADSLSPWRREKTVDFRIKDFEDWIESRPEQTIVVVGHSVYFKRMLNLPKTFDNCDVWEAKYDSSATPESKRSNRMMPSNLFKSKEAIANENETHDLPRGWTSLRRLYKYTPEEIPEFDELAQ